MNVKNRKCIRKLSLKSLYANRRRNLIAIFAIALTTLLFTSMFTIVLSLNASYETYQFRQVGGYAHGTFKDVSPEQAERIAAHPKVKAAGIRKVIGITAEGVFAKVPAEISYMDANCTKWSYATPTTGRMPESGKEVAMDTAALQLLGVTPELGAEVTVSYSITDKDQTAFTVTDTFTLVGYWDYDELMPVHYINISRDYADDIEAQAVKTGLQPFRTDLNVMLASGTNIQGQMEQVDTDLGYTWDSYTDPNSVRIGVNWGYTSSQLESKLDPELVIAIAAFLLLVIFTGYLIIYNIFQISVAGDIRFYGLLKTIGTTPRQLKRIIRQQALLLCLIGIPAGLLLGYGIGAVLVPVVLHSIQLDTGITTISTSPVIFLGSMLFALLTVLLSCSKPGKMAAKVSPVEATKYTDVMQTKKKRRSIRGAKLHQMAFANLGRNKKKTVLVVVSLALSVTLFNALCAFVGGFSMEKYVSAMTCADFIVSTPDYFRYNPADEFITPEQIEEIAANTKATEDSEECVNDTWLITWNKIPPKTPTKLSAFLGKITRNLALDNFRKKNASKRADTHMMDICGEVEKLENTIKDYVEEDIKKKEILNILEKFLSDLKAGDRDIFVRRYWYMDNIKDIAKRHGCSETKIKSSLFRSRNKLWEEVKEII